MIGLYFSQFKWLFLEQIRGIYFSDVLIMIIVAAIVCFVPGYILYIKKGLPVRKIVLSFFTVMYLGAILMLTIIRREVGSKSGQVYTHINLGLTTHGVYSTRQVIYSFFNIVLFVPWGIFMGLYRTAQKPLQIVFMTTLTGFITSFLIEVIQSVTKTGIFEVTDLFTNVLGTFIGGLLVAIGVIISKRMAK